MKQPTLDSKALFLRFLGLRQYHTKYLSIIVHSIGIYIFYSLVNIFQEKISTSKYGDSKFKAIYFPMILQSIGAMIASFVLSKIKKETLALKNRITFYNYLLLSVLSMISTIFWYYSLGFLSYPTVIISKSCKLLSIAIMNFLVLRKRLSVRKYASIFLTTISVLCFAMLGKLKEGQKGFSLLGILILIFNLSIDGLLNVLQDNIFNNHNVSSCNMMFYCSFIRFITSIGLFCFTKESNYTLRFVKNNKEILFDLLCSSFLSVLGQLVIYSMLEKHGSYVVTTINITRKIFSIVLSLLLFGHEVKFLQWLCIFGVILSISLELFDNKKKGNKIN